MVFAIIGSREFGSYNILEKYLSNFKISHIVSGGAKGADTLAIVYAKERDIPYTVYVPDYTKYKRAAPLIRNTSIIKEADVCIAFWDGKSSGTKHALGLAEKKGIPIHICDYKL